MIGVPPRPAGKTWRGRPGLRPARRAPLPSVAAFPATGAWLSARFARTAASPPDRKRRAMLTVTPTEVAVQLFGPSHGHSRSPGARRVRVLARRLYPRSAPGKGGAWALTTAQAVAIMAEHRFR